ncbi:MAG: hypothetical protein L0Z55_01560 [Planctomycetes bacterium]|nr:hypothetical protein [Planctomycetota bacterium]
MRRLAFAGVVILALAAGIYFLSALFDTEEARIVRRIQAMADAFNARRAGGAVSGLEETITCSRDTIERDLIKGWLAREFLGARSGGGEFAFFVRLARDSAVVTLDPEGMRATVRVDVAFEEQLPGSVRQFPEFALDLTMHKDDEGEWLVRSVDTEDIEERVPFR